ncbi:hypothetical protein E2562_008046 [Oryza meyeriana var. granulata]|uniref:Uncharacterized protein n=1 Tax=Oryza meyeriana var. granulata TaxID=110450 RepID=A0A6G1DFV2_9ORYZ|nr:hypothetical protein E2562_008046 [Oryza meyeriana var. granulata]
MAAEFAAGAEARLCMPGQLAGGSGFRPLTAERDEVRRAPARFGQQQRRQNSGGLPRVNRHGAGMAQPGAASRGRTAWSSHTVGLSRRSIAWCSVRVVAAMDARSTRLAMMQLQMGLALAQRGRGVRWWLSRLTDQARLG